MPSKSKEQAKLMAAAAHNEEFARKSNIDPKVAKEWHAADMEKAKDDKDFADMIGMHPDEPAQGSDHRSKDW